MSNDSQAPATIDAAITRYYQQAPEESRLETRITAGESG